MAGAAEGAGRRLLWPHREGHVPGDQRGRGRGRRGRAHHGGVRMSKASTVDALRKRGVAKRTAEILANAGFTLEKIAGSKPDRLKKFIGEKDATRILQKVGGATAEKAPPTSKGKAPAGPKVKPKPGAPAIPAEGEAPPELPAKAPQ